MPWSLLVAGIVYDAWVLANPRVDMRDAPTWVTAGAAVALAVFVAWGALSAYSQLKDQRRVLERQGEERTRRVQVARITAKPTSAWTAFKRMKKEEKEGHGCMAVVVANASGRPVQQVRCRLLLKGTPQAPAVTYRAAPPHRDADGTHPDRLYEPVPLPPGDQRWFIWPVLLPFTTSEFPPFLVRYSDEAGMDWQVDEDLRLRESPDSEW